jgi:hypothetical protein
MCCQENGNNIMLPVVTKPSPSYSLKLSIYCRGSIHRTLAPLPFFAIIQQDLRKGKDRIRYYNSKACVSNKIGNHNL